MDWAVLTFDPSVSKEQRDAIARILGHVYPVKWNSFTVAKDADMEWVAESTKAHARLGGGKVAEVVLRHPEASAMADGPVVIKNLKYFGVPRNDGFIMMPNEVEAYRLGDKAFEYKGTNGFMITIDIASRDVPATANGRADHMDYSVAKQVNSCWIAFYKMDPKAKSFTCANGFNWPAYTEAGDEAAQFTDRPRVVKSKTIPNGPPRANASGG